MVSRLFTFTVEPVYIILADCTCAAYTPLNTRYYLVFENKNWTDANKYCHDSYKAKLVTIADQVDQLRLHTFLDSVAGQTDYMLVLCLS